LRFLQWRVEAFYPGVPEQGHPVTAPLCAWRRFTDTSWRIISEPLGKKKLAQSVAVVNKIGGGGVVGAGETARAVPDGYYRWNGNGIDHCRQSGHQLKMP
jgi:hypothetical protein